MTPNGSNLYWDDEGFQDALVQLLCRDAKSLQDCGALLSADDFKPTAQGDGTEVWLLASWALDYYRERGEPIGGLLRTWTLDKADELRFGAKQVQKLLGIE